MNGQSSTLERGFTIIETMIYLAVAGALFVITLFYLGGKQRSTQFSQGVREFESTLNDVANDTATGVFPSPPNVECYTSANLIRFRSVSAPAGDPVRPGENNACVFVGNVVQLTNSESGKTAADYFVHTLVGKRDLSSNDFTDTDPVPLYESGVVDGTRQYTVPWGVTVKKAYVEDNLNGNIESINALGYLYSRFGDSFAIGSDIKSGVANISLYVRENTTKRTLNDFRADINYELSPAATKLVPLGDRSIVVCLDDLDGRTAMIRIGGDTGSHNATANFNQSAECAS